MDRGVESVSCDFLLPTLCEMDEHPSLQVDLLKSEFIIAIVAAFLGILLILVVCCFWCCKVIILFVPYSRYIFKNISIYIFTTKVLILYKPHKISFLGAIDKSSKERTI